MDSHTNDKQKRIEDCRELYLKYEGGSHELIEKEMRALGHSNFHRRIMYKRFERGRCRDGWIGRYGWDSDVRQASESSGSPPYKGGVAAASADGVVLASELDQASVNDVQKSSFRDCGNKNHPVGETPPPLLCKEGSWVAAASGDGVVLSSESDQASMNAGAYKQASVNAEAKNHPVGETPPPLLCKEGSRSSGRTVAEDDFAEFQEWLHRVSPKMTWTWKHQVYIYRYLKRVFDGHCKRLMIYLPPRHGKSELVTVRYAAWQLKQNPSQNVIIGSYNQRLANRFSRKVRRVLADDHALTAEPCGRHGEEEKGRRGAANRTDRGTGSNGSSQRLGGSAVNQPDSFPFTNRRANSDAEWETSEGGGLRAVGVGAGVTGYGAQLIIIDDPVKSRAEAESETYSNRVWDWFNNDIYTRLEPNGAIILIQTRWRENDLGGRLLREMKEEGGEQWEVVNLPALAEGPSTTDAKEIWPQINADDADKLRNNSIYPDPDLRNLRPSAAKTLPQSGDSAVQLSADPLGRRPGDALCPQRYDEEALERLRRKLGSYSFASLYQQRPVPAEGGLFKREWFVFADYLPPGVHKKRGWDLGISKGDDADYTATAGVAFDDAGNVYIYDVFRFRHEYPVQRKIILGRIQAEPDTEHGIELSANGNAVFQDLRTDPRARGRALRGLKPKGDKITRALPWIALAEERRVFLVRGPWNRDFIEEACSFPSGTHDDQIDAVSLAIQMHRERSSRLHRF